MLQIDISTIGLEKHLGAMLGRLRHFKSVDVGQVLSDWQTEDMHRQKPFTMRSRRAGKAVTRARPHSRYETLHMRRALRRHVRRGEAAMRSSTRPILRPELYAELWDRFQQAVHEKLHW